LFHIGDGHQLGADAGCTGEVQGRCPQPLAFRDSALGGCAGSADTGSPEVMIGAPQQVAFHLCAGPVAVQVIGNQRNLPGACARLAQNSIPAVAGDVIEPQGDCSHVVLDVNSIPAIQQIIRLQQHRRRGVDLHQVAVRCHTVAIVDHQVAQGHWSADGQHGVGADRTLVGEACTVQTFHNQRLGRLNGYGVAFNEVIPQYGNGRNRVLGIHGIFQRSPAAIQQVIPAVDVARAVHTAGTGIIGNKNLRRAGNHRNGNKPLLGLGPAGAVVFQHAHQHRAGLGGGLVDAQGESQGVAKITAPERGEGAACQHITGGGCGAIGETGCIGRTGHAAGGFRQEITDRPVDWGVHAHLDICFGIQRRVVGSQVIIAPQAQPLSGSAAAGGAGGWADKVHRSAQGCGRSGGSGQTQRKR